MAVGRTQSEDSANGMRFLWGKLIPRHAALVACAAYFCLAASSLVAQQRAVTRAAPPVSSQNAAAQNAAKPEAAKLEVTTDFKDDARLTARVSLACKNVAFSELCRRLQAATGVSFTAGSLVADDNITLFCHERPVAEILPAIARLFNFTWRREGEPAAARYELTQTALQIAQERQAREEDHLSALRLLDEDMEKYRPYLNLSPAQLDALMERTRGEEQQRIRYFRHVICPIATLYLTLSRAQKQEFLAGKRFEYSTENDPSSLPRAVREMIFAEYSDIRVYHTATGGGSTRSTDTSMPSVAEASDAYCTFHMQIKRDRQGSFALYYRHEIHAPSLGYPLPSMPPDTDQTVFMPTAARAPIDNARANAAFAALPHMRRIIPLTPRPTYAVNAPAPIAVAPAPAVTGGDVEEAFWAASGLDVIGDSFASLSPLRLLAVQPMPLFNSLCRNSDTLYLRWRLENRWLTFRKPNYYNLRVQQIPTRVLEHWAISRREHGGASLDDVVEMANLTPEQTNHATEACACALYGLMEWPLAQNEILQPHWRLLAQMPSGLRRLTLTPQGLPFARLPLNLRPMFISLACGGLHSAVQPGLAEFADAVLRVYYKPGQNAQAATVKTPAPNANSPASIQPLPPIKPGYEAQFSYTFGSKRTGRYRHNIRPNGFNFDTPGEFKEPRG